MLLEFAGGSFCARYLIHSSSLLSELSVQLLYMCLYDLKNTQESGIHKFIFNYFLSTKIYEAKEL